MTLAITTEIFSPEKNKVTLQKSSLQKSIMHFQATFFFRFLTFLTFSIKWMTWFVLPCRCSPVRVYAVDSRLGNCQSEKWAEERRVRQPERHHWLGSLACQPHHRCTTEHSQLWAVRRRISQHRQPCQVRSIQRLQEISSAASKL